MNSKHSTKKNKRRGHKVQNDVKAGRGGDYPYLPGSILSVEFYPEPLGFSNDGEVRGTREKTESSIPLAFTVVKTLSRTLSCVLLVSLNLERLKESERAVLDSKATITHDGVSRQELRAVLKLYDRRFSNGIREDYGAAPWTLDIEDDFRRFEAIDERDKPEVCVKGENDSWLYRSIREVEEAGEKEKSDKVEVAKQNKSEKSKSGRKRKNNRTGSLRKNTKVDGEVNHKIPQQKRISPSRWTPGHLEAYMQKVCDAEFDTELTVYRHLKGVQGKYVPVVYGAVRIQIGTGSAQICQGILMEYIHPSFTLREIPKNVEQRSVWQELGEMAVKLVQNIGDLGVLDEDVRLDNILIFPVKDGCNSGDSDEQDDGDDDDDGEDRKLKYFKAIRIDFGLARLQREDSETSEDWRKARHFRDEEGAVGFVLESYLRTAAGTEWQDRPFKFKHSNKLQDYDYEADI